MKANWLMPRMIACAVLFCAGVLHGQAAPAPIPAAIPAAKSIFVSNGGADSGLFPEPFSGDMNRGYDQLFAALESSGRFRLVSDPSSADLVLEIKLVAPYGPTNGSKQNGASDPLPMFRLTVYDAKSHFVLWTITNSVGFAILQKTHDHNFDMALNEVVSEFMALAGKAGMPAGGGR